MTKKISSKKEIRISIAKTLTAQFENLKDIISEKRFRKNVKKASKILAAGVKEKSANGKIKTAAKKTTTLKKVKLATEVAN